MAHSSLAHETLLKRLDALANDSLHYWALPAGSTVRLLNVSENATYLVVAPDGTKRVLRVHREAYHSERAIECELAWAHALRAADFVRTPAAIPGCDGRLVQTGVSADLPNPRHMVMFEHVPGEQPEESHDLVGPFEDLGAMAARLHEHAIHWQRPAPFRRLTWDLDAVYGPEATWGDWRKVPNLDSQMQAVLERVEQTVKARLERFGQSAQRYGLIHADMRLANLLIDGAQTWLIDFDDCGFGWFLYDFAAGISFIEDSPAIPAMREAWVRGYRRVRDLPHEEEREIDSFIMLRRMALTAWIASHINVPEAEALAPDFARVSAELGEDYLLRMG
jgi:Ser/Thr protein kinase RdoA (MazF antagonist)